MSDEKPQEEELGGLIDETTENARKIIGKTAKIHKWAQQVVDLGDTGRRVVKFPFSNDMNWNPAINSWQRANEQTNAILQNLDEMNVGTLSSTGSGLSAVMTTLTDPSNLDPSLPPQFRTEVLSAQENLSKVIDDSIDQEDIITTMRQFGLDKAHPGEKSAIEQFETAWVAFEKPVAQTNPVSTSLIPMRETIESMIKELIRLRPNQERAKSQKDKISSIGRQLAKNGIQQTDIQSWADQWDQLANELSGAKQKDYSREEWRNLLRRATLFLQEVLQGLDPAKLRSPR
jgi:hypothetical protein